MKPFKTRSKFVLKKVVVKCYGEISLKILKGKTHKFHKNKSPIMYLLGTTNLTNQKNKFKRTFKNKVQF